MTSLETTHMHRCSLPEETRQQRLNRIRRVSTCMQWVAAFICLLILITAGLVLAVVVNPALCPDVTATMIGLDDIKRPLGDIPLAQRMGLGVISTLAFAILLAVFVHVTQLFRRFRQADFFSSDSLRRMVSLGRWLMAFGVYDILCDPVASILSTLDLPKGQKSLAFSLDGTELFFVTFGSLVLVFGWILREAALIQDENSQFI
ncbi:DUF2975 domain-containing protein [Roseibium suaedae]|uniref:DUF2975 domain-containing protein n=1 Tax=Roseibium suaedae TaxID=735517 RepID=A0A1M7C1X1_9HYPH|nr:DUF2975 domain-containing protein [Roseibium suaedae]SHL61204.1 Protein of unknown function [Roseibium suaedae]